MLDALVVDLVSNKTIETNDYLSEHFTPLELMLMTWGVLWLLQQLSTLWKKCGTNNILSILHYLKRVYQIN
jgi:hypothetical protein